MYEGVFSLMQMAKTSAALAFHSQANLPYQCFDRSDNWRRDRQLCLLGDIILAEPHAMIGFPGPALSATQPMQTFLGFQTSEFLQHGLSFHRGPHGYERILISLLGYMSPQLPSSRRSLVCLNCQLFKEGRKTLLHAFRVLITIPGTPKPGRKQNTIRWSL